MEAIATVLSLRDGVIPPTANLENPTIGRAARGRRRRTRKVELTAAITDSFGFGGHNVALAFTKA